MKAAATLGAALALLLACAAAPAQSMFRGDAAHAGVYGGPAPRAFHRVRWSFPTGDRVVGSPAWSDGDVVFGSDDGRVYAVDAATGRQRWSFRTGGPVPSSPAVGAGRVHVASYDGKVYALDAKTGALLWTFATAGERRFEAKGLHGLQPRNQTIADTFDVYLSSPTLVDGALYVGSGDGHLYALDAATGELRWTFATGDVVHASPAVADGIVYVGSWDSRLYAVDARTGAERWRFQAGTDDLLHNQVGFQSSPAVVDGTVYVGCRDANLYAIDAVSGKEKWRFPTAGSWVVTSPAVRDGRVYFATSDSSLLHAVDAATGKAIWQQQGAAYVFASPALAGDVLLVGVLNGSLEARDAGSGALLWRWQTDAARVNAGWVLDAEGRFNGGLVFPSPWREKPAVGFERQTSVGSLFSSPLVVNGVVYVGSADGRVYAIE